MWLTKIYRTYKKRVAENSFYKNSTLGSRANIHHSAHCSNSGSKEQIVIGEHCEIKSSICVYGTAKIQIGKHFYGGGHTYIHAADCIRIGDCVIVSDYVRIMDNNSHPTSPKKRWDMSVAGWDSVKAEHAPVVIEDNVWIGEFATVLKGVTIGRGAVIGSHSVVTHDVPPYSIAVGNPAQVVKTIQPE